jgi:hypothetical protein
MQEKNTRKAENASNENKKNTKRVQEVDTEDTEEEVKYVISEVLSNKSKCWISKVRINNVDINFKLDTGAEVNIIPINYLNKVGMDKEEVKRFLGMINHLSIFIPNVSQINAPLRELVKHDVLWHWDRPQREAFDQLKQLLIKAPVMQYFDPSKKIVIQTDASKSGLGCCLLQDNHPIVYSSRSLSECEQNYAQIEKELLAIMYSLEKFHYYTYGQHVEIQTDHKPLLVIVNKDITKTTARLQRLLLKLLKYNFSLTFVAGKHMHIADTLSRGYIKSKEDSDSEIDYAVHSIRKNLSMSDVRKEAV